MSPSRRRYKVVQLFSAGSYAENSIQAHSLARQRTLSGNFALAQITEAYTYEERDELSNVRKCGDRHA